MHASSDRTPSRPFAVVLASITLIGPLSIHFFLPVIPELRGAFGISNAVAQFTFSVTLVTMAVMTLVYGALSDRYGRRPVLLTGLLLFIGGSLLAAAASSVAMLVGARLLQAVGAGCGVALARVIARDAYGPEKLVTAIAYLTMAYTLGPMTAPPLGGFLVDQVGWRSVFWFTAAFGAAITVAAFFVLHETHSERQPGDAPLRRIPRDFMRLFGHLRFSALVFQTGLSSGVFYTLATASTFLMQGYLHRSATEFGIYFLMFPIGYCLGNLLSSRLSRRVPLEHMVLAGSCLLVATVLVQGTVIGFGIITPLVIFVPGFTVSVAQGLSIANAQAGAIRAVPSLAGMAAGAGVFVQMLCGAIFSQAYGFLSDGTPFPMVEIASVSAALAMVAGVTAYVTRERETDTAGRTVPGSVARSAAKSAD